MKNKCDKTDVSCQCVNYQNLQLKSADCIFEIERNLILSIAPTTLFRVTLSYFTFNILNVNSLPKTLILHVTFKILEALCDFFLAPMI